MSMMLRVGDAGEVTPFEHWPDFLCRHKKDLSYGYDFFLPNLKDIYFQIVLTIYQK